MSRAAKAAQYGSAANTASQQRVGRASLARALYVAAVILATSGWLWLIASTAMKLL
jgi:hypothetical protein